MNNLSLRSSSALEYLSHTTSADEVVEYLNSLAVQANQSVASALKAQVQVIKYISKPDLIGSTFDLFFKNLKNALTHCKDEEGAYEIREKAGLMLNNFIFFTKAKIEYELLVNRKEGERLFVQASDELAKTVCEVALLSCGDASSAALTTTTIKNLSRVFFNPEEQGDNLFKKAARWLFKRSRTETKQMEFAETLDTLADKLLKYYDIIGENDLIAGIYENYYDHLMEYHSIEWTTHFANAEEKLEIAWQAPLFILGIGGGLSAIVWFVRWIVSLFSPLSTGWAVTQWMWTGIITGGIALIVAAIFLILYMVENRKGNKIYYHYRNYYTGIQSIFSE